MKFAKINGLHAIIQITPVELINGGECALNKNHT